MVITRSSHILVIQLKNKIYNLYIPLTLLIIAIVNTCNVYLYIKYMFLCLCLEGVSGWLELFIKLSKTKLETFQTVPKELITNKLRLQVQGVYY